MFWKSLLQNGSSSVIPSEPLVSGRRLTARIWAASSSAIVMMTNACPRVRSTTSPASVATTTAVIPPSGAIHSGLTPVCRAMIATVYDPRPRNMLWPREV